MLYGLLYTARNIQDNKCLVCLSIYATQNVFIMYVCKIYFAETCGFCWQVQ